MVPAATDRSRRVRVARRDDAADAVAQQWSERDLLRADTEQSGEGAGPGGDRRRSGVGLLGDPAQRRGERRGGGDALPECGDLAGALQRAGDPFGGRERGGADRRPDRGGPVSTPGGQRRTGQAADARGEGHRLGTARRAGGGGGGHTGNASRDPPSARSSPRPERTPVSLPFAICAGERALGRSPGRYWSPRWAR